MSGLLTKRWKLNLANPSMIGRVKIAIKGSIRGGMCWSIWLRGATAKNTCNCNWPQQQNTAMKQRGKPFVAEYCKHLLMLCSSSCASRPPTSPLLINKVFVGSVHDHVQANILFETSPHQCPRMSTTTQILFNSPALHSLKRDQLVKLCKIHSIKASGKNVDLINKLKQHASTLPKDAPLSIAARSEDAAEAMDVDEQPDSDKENRNQTAYRPSEQWEMVMDSIAETDEAGSSQGTVSTKRGEFGTASSRGTSPAIFSQCLSSGSNSNRYNRHLLDQSPCLFARNKEEHIL